MSLGKDFQTLLIELWTIEPMSVQELLPFAAPGLTQQLGSRKLLHETPTRSRRPVLKSLQRRRIILMESRLKLIDQLGAFVNEFHFIAAKQAQFLGQRIQRIERPPTVAVDPQRITQTPGVQIVGLGTAGSFSVAIAFGTLGSNRVNEHPALQQWCDGGTRTWSNCP